MGGSGRAPPPPRSSLGNYAPSPVCQAGGEPIDNTAMRSAPDDITDTLGSLAIFADLSRPDLERVAHTLEERYFAQDERVLREGLSGSAFYIVLEGEAAVIAAGKRGKNLGGGDFFREVLGLFGEGPACAIVAARPLPCLGFPGALLEGFLPGNSRGGDPANGGQAR